MNPRTSKLLFSNMFSDGLESRLEFLLSTRIVHMKVDVRLVSGSSQMKVRSLVKSNGGYVTAFFHFALLVG